MCIYKHEGNGFMISQAISRRETVMEQELLDSEEIEHLKNILLEKRNSISTRVDSLKTDAVAGLDSVNWEEDGTDAFDREFAFKVAGSGDAMLNQIDAALHKIEEGTYGVCEMCGKKIGRLRMEALPFCETCIECQSESEAGSSRGRFTV